MQLVGKRAGIALLAASALLIPACTAEEIPASYSAQARADFIQTCTDSVNDPELIVEVCKCVFDTAQTEISIEIFRSYDEELKNNPTASLPEPLADMMAQCVLDETGLRG